MSKTFYLNNQMVESDRDEPTVELFYPRCEGNCDSIIVGLCDTRAADGLRITYDFDRDGYSIQQASKFEWDADDEVCDPDWQEVAFVQAWARDTSA